MPHLLVRHKVRDVEAWRRVFDSHSVPQHDAGLVIKHVFHNTEDPNELFLLFEAESVEGARGFVTSPRVADAQMDSGVMDKPDIYFLDEA